MCVVCGHVCVCGITEFSVMKALFCPLGANFHHLNVPSNLALIIKTRSFKSERKTFQEEDFIGI
jgi:hypothetical protein